MVVGSVAESEDRKGRADVVKSSFETGLVRVGGTCELAAHGDCRMSFRSIEYLTTPCSSPCTGGLWLMFIYKLTGGLPKRV